MANERVLSGVLQRAGAYAGEPRARRIRPVELNRGPTVCRYQVTGDRHLPAVEPPGVKVVSPSALGALLAGADE